jgi:hypothetical protein
VKHPDEVEEEILEYVRYIEKQEGEAHDRGYSFRSTAQLRALRERLMKEIWDYRLLYAKLHMPVLIIAADGKVGPS